MKNVIGPVAVLSMAVALVFAQGTPSYGDVIVNNLLSPGTLIQVAPGSAYVGPRHHSGYGFYESGYDGRPDHYRSGHHGRGHGPRGAYCWVATDRDRGYGYWQRCR